jgi:site-specific recombinase XerD
VLRRSAARTNGRQTPQVSDGIVVAWAARKRRQIGHARSDGEVHAVMQAAGLEGVPASPKGLRHGFGVAAVTAGIPLNLVQKWLGHAQLSTTAVYANAVGAEEKDIARRMWG